MVMMSLVFLFKPLVLNLTSVIKAQNGQYNFKSYFDAAKFCKQADSGSNFQFSIFQQRIAVNARSTINMQSAPPTKTLATIGVSNYA